MAKIMQSVRRRNLEKFRRLRKEGFQVGQVGFTSRPAARSALKKSQIRKKSNLSLRQAQDVRTGRPAFFFVRKRRR